MLGRERAELREQVAAVLLHHRAELRRAGDATRRGECLPDLVGGEVPQRTCSYTRSASVRTARTSIMLARSTAWRHGDGRTCMNATSIRNTLPSCTSRFAGLMSRCASPAVPQLADQQQPFVDDVVVDVGVADLLRAVEELGDEQVLACRRQLDDAVRRRGGDAGVAHEAQRVVLVLDEPPHRLERRLVLESAVEERATELVPAVGPHVVHRVELPEQVGVGVALDA